MKFNEGPKRIKTLVLSAFLLFTPLKTGDKTIFSKPEKPQQNKEQAETTEKKKEDTFIYIGEGTTDSLEIELIGIHHPPSLKFSKHGRAYSDPSLINNFFQKLKDANINPEKVVLIVEEDVPENNQVLIREGNSIFVTPEMSSMGFKKWVPADTRAKDSPDTKKYFEAGNKLSQLINKYLKISTTGKLDLNGLPILSFEFNKNIPKEDLETLKDCLRINAIPDIAFEKNLMNIYTSLKKQGYKTIVLAGRQHTLALPIPSLFQTSKITNENEKNVTMQEIEGYLAFTKGSRYLAKELLGYE